MAASSKRQDRISRLLREKKKKREEKRGSDLICLPLDIPQLSSDLAFLSFIHSSVVDSITFFDKGVPVAAAVVKDPILFFFPFHLDELLVSALAFGYGVGF